MKRVLVGISGGIAAYKAAEVVRELQRRGHDVRVVMTASAEKFVGAITFTGLTGKPAITDLWDPAYAGEVHVELGTWADAIIVVPATANLIARYAHGQADDVLTATLLCARGSIVIAPAMHHRMWSHAATVQNIATLRERGVVFAGPIEGALASGEVGMGRMEEPTRIVDLVERTVSERHDLQGRAVVISAGPTIEDLDPVRFLGNRSTGRMGFALAERALARGANVTIVAGPVSLPTPTGATRIDVRGALQMQEALDGCYPGADAIIMTAAVADYRPREIAAEKLKKQGENASIELVRNPDILAGLGARRNGTRPVLVGFAVETQDLESYARRKLIEKKVDFIVGNLASDGFAGEENVACIVDDTRAQMLTRMTKRALADEILDRVVRKLQNASEPRQET